MKTPIEVCIEKIQKRKNRSKKLADGAASRGDLEKSLHHLIRAIAFSDALNILLNQDLKGK